MLENWIYILLVTLVPGIELRGSLPIAVLLGENLELAFLITTAVNILLVPLLLRVFDFAWEKLGRINRLQNLMDLYVHRVKNKSYHLVQKYGAVGLMLFVAVPLPGTGAYTGCLAAWLLGVRKKDALMSISAGVLIAGSIVYLALKGVLLF